MPYKTILCSLGDDDGHKAGIEAAMTVAASHGAHLIGLYAIEPLVLPVDPMSSLPAELYDRYEADSEAQASAIRDLFLDAARRHGVAAQWRTERGYRRDVVQEHSPYADLVIISRASGRREKSEANTLAADLAMTTGRPVLYLPEGMVPARIGSKVLVAWNGSREAARAVTDALPFLQAAERVAVVSARQSTGVAMDIGAVLARHGVPVATQNIEAAADTRIGDMLLREADRQQCNLMVMGIYGHNRMNEWVFGGVSRHVLEHATVPLLIAH